MELKERYLILRKRVKLIIFITLISTITSGVLSYFVIEPRYKTEISVIIGKTETEKNNSLPNYNDIKMYQTMVKTYSKLTKSRIVAEDVIENLNFKEMSTSDLIPMIMVAPDQDTQFLTITVESKEPKQAMIIANQYAKSLKEVSIKINKVDIVEIIDEAQLPKKPDSPKPLINIALAGFFGIFLSVGLVFLLNYLDNTIKTKEDVEKACKLPVIGTISLVTKENKDVMIW